MSPLPQHGSQTCGGNRSPSAAISASVHSHGARKNHRTHECWSGSQRQGYLQSFVACGDYATHVF
jgi:hypothetical protein